MKLIGNLRKTTEKAYAKEELEAHNKDAVNRAALDDNVLEKISGGVGAGTGEIGAGIVDVASKAGAAGKAGKVSKKVIK